MFGLQFFLFGSMIIYGSFAFVVDRSESTEIRDALKRLNLSENTSVTYECYDETDCPTQKPLCIGRGSQRTGYGRCVERGGPTCENDRDCDSYETERCVTGRCVRS